VARHGPAVLLVALALLALVVAAAAGARAAPREAAAGAEHLSEWPSRSRGSKGDPLVTQGGQPLDPDVVDAQVRRFAQGPGPVSAPSCRSAGQVS
jgi:hypothetical protein